MEGNDAAFVRIAVTIDGTELHGPHPYANAVETRFAAAQTGMEQTLNNRPILSSIAERAIKKFREEV